MGLAMYTTPKAWSSRRMLTFLLALPAVATLSACSESVSFDGVYCGSVESVIHDADGVIRAEVVSEVGRYLDSGGNEGVGDYQGGIPMVQFELRVLDLYGSEPPGTTTISYLDAGAGEFLGEYDQEVLPLQVGDDIILMYRQLDPSERPGRMGSVLVPVGGEDGVMDVFADGTVSPRSGSVRVVSGDQESMADAPEHQAPVLFKLTDVSSLATAHNADSSVGESGN